MEKESTRDSDAPGEAMISVQRQICGVGLCQGHGRGSRMQGYLVGIQGQDYCGGDQGKSVVGPLVCYLVRKCKGKCGCVAQRRTHGDGGLMKWYSKDHVGP